MPIVIEVKKNEQIDRALRRLKNEMKNEGVMKELKDRRYFEKPSIKKRKKQAEARKRKAIEQKQARRKGL